LFCAAAVQQKTPMSPRRVLIGESSRFLKKAAQKLLLLWAGGGETSTAQIIEVFLLLFVHKKKAFLFA
jgi:hypothetical protein